MLANCSQQAVEVLLPPLAEATGAQFWKISSIRMACTAGKDARLALSGYGYRWFSRSLS